jgi:GTP1/Obg family GTP-binding protein
MKESFEPQIDPWELMIEHNQRIQRLEQQCQQQAATISEIVKAINNLNQLQEVHRRTVDKILDNQQQSALLMAQILTQSTSTATGPA